MNKREIELLISRLEEELQKAEGETIDAEFTELAPKDTALTIYALDDQPGTEYTEPAPTTFKKSKKYSSLLKIIPLTIFILLVTLAPFLIVPIYTAKATVTIYASQQNITKNFVFTQKDLSIRHLQTITLSQSKKVNTSGIVSRGATPARGEIYLYNASPAAQEIDTGTQITTTAGVQVITDETVIIAGAAAPTEGSARVTAHTLTTGIQSNIPADFTTQACCKAYIFEKNAQFYGGQEATTYRTPTTGDIETATATIKTALDEEMLSAIHTQLLSNEAILQNTCTNFRLSDAQPGTETNTVTITVTETCNASTYNRSELNTAAFNAIVREARTVLESEYTPSNVFITNVSTITANNTEPEIKAAVTGLFTYQIDAKERQILKNTIAGKNPREANILVFQLLKGVTKAEIDSPATLPTADRINIQVVY